MIETICLLADENIQESLIKWLKEEGFNISGIRSKIFIDWMTKQ